MKAHKVCRTQKPDIYPKRFFVPDSLVAWKTHWTDYDPDYVTAQVVLDNDCTHKENGWADPENPVTARLLLRPDQKFQSYEGRVKLVHDYPLNPRGRTGLRGRGLLGKWGANFAADPIVFRINPETNKLEMIAIKRRDTGEWAIPGGMVDYGERVSKTLTRELKEETGVQLDFSQAVLVYKGYVDDPRNTDNAWMETAAYCLFLEPEIAEQVNLKAGDDAVGTQWLKINKQNLEELYASHAEIIKKALKRLNIKVN